MRADQAKTIPLDLYLEHQGYKPAKSRMDGRELWYHSPIRNGDSSPSFKVDTIINKWYDHGLGRGGNTLDLAIELCCSNVRDALQHLERTGLYSQFGYRRSSQPSKLEDLLESRRAAVEKEKNGAAFRLLREGSVNHPALLQYLEKRKINRELVDKYLKQIHFSPSNSSKQYFAIGWPSGMGYEARNSLFKGFVGTGKGVTYLNTPDASVCAIFEGFLDFLAFMSFHELQDPPFSVIVLNSGALKGRAVEQLLSCDYQEVKLFLDNDQAGDAGTAYFEGSLKNVLVSDQRHLYQGFKDFNEMTMNG